MYVGVRFFVFSSRSIAGARRANVINGIEKKRKKSIAVGTTIWLSAHAEVT